MKKLINNWYRNHSLIYKVLLFLCTTLFIVYLFPKTGKFRYSFEKGKPWQSENLYAPLDFAIEKSKEQMESERQLIIDNSDIYFELNNETVTNVKNSFADAFNRVFSDSLITPIKDYSYVYPSSGSLLTSNFF